MSFIPIRIQIEFQIIMDSAYRSELDTYIADFGFSEVGGRPWMLFRIFSLCLIILASRYQIMNC